MHVNSLIPENVRLTLKSNLNLQHSLHRLQSPSKVESHMRDVYNYARCIGEWWVRGNLGIQPEKLNQMCEGLLQYLCGAPGQYFNNVVMLYSAASQIGKDIQRRNLYLKAKFHLSSLKLQQLLLMTFFIQHYMAQCYFRSHSQSHL